MKTRLTLSSKWFAWIVVPILAVQALAQVAEETTSPEIEAAEIGDGVYLLGLFCNVLAVEVAHGLLIVDSGPDWEVEVLKKAVTRLAAGPVRFVLNTHFHYDHVGNNASLAGSGAVIVAQEQVRQRMQVEWAFPDALGIQAVPPFPEAALPMLSFGDGLTVHAGGNEIEVLHLPGAHSGADAVVWLSEANVLHTGDLYLSNGFPPIDSFHGGSVDGLIAALDVLVNLIDDDTKVVPGHGTLSNRQELSEYRLMLAMARDRIIALIRKGRTLDEIVAANPTAGLYKRGESWIRPELFVRTAYEDLARQYSEADDVSD